MEWIANNYKYIYAITQLIINPNIANLNLSFINYKMAVRATVHDFFQASINHHFFKHLVSDIH